MKLDVKAALRKLNAALTADQLITLLEKGTDGNFTRQTAEALSALATAAADADHAYHAAYEAALEAQNVALEEQITKIKAVSRALPTTSRPSWDEAKARYDRDKKLFGIYFWHGEVDKLMASPVDISVSDEARERLTAKIISNRNNLRDHPEKMRAIPSEQREPTKEALDALLLYLDPGQHLEARVFLEARQATIPRF